MPHLTAPEPRRDNLPDAPPIEEETDIAQAHAPRPAMALHAGPGPGPGPIAALPPAYTDPNRQTPPHYSAAPPQPAHGSLRDDGAFVPEGKPEEWDITSSISRH